MKRKSGIRLSALRKKLMSEIGKERARKGEIKRDSNGKFASKNTSGVIKIKGVKPFVNKGVADKFDKTLIKGVSNKNASKRDSFVKELTSKVDGITNLDKKQQIKKYIKETLQRNLNKPNPSEEVKKISTPKKDKQTISSYLKNTGKVKLYDKEAKGWDTQKVKQPVKKEPVKREITGTHDDLPNMLLKSLRSFKIIKEDQNGNKFFGMVHELTTKEITDKKDSKDKELGITKKEITEEEYNVLVSTKFKDIKPRGQIVDNLDEITTKMSKLTGVSKEESTKSLDGIRQYTGGGYSSIRAYESGGDIASKSSGASEENTKLKGLVDSINNYIKKAPPYKGEIFRGLGFKTETELENFFSGLDRDSGYLLEAMSSFTTNRKVLEDYATESAQPYTVALSVLDNKSGVSIRAISTFYEEEEILTPKGALYKVKKIDKKEGTNNYYITLEE